MQFRHAAHKEFWLQPCKAKTGKRQSTAAADIDDEMSWGTLADAAAPPDQPAVLPEAASPAAVVTDIFGEDFDTGLQEEDLDEDAWLEPLALEEALAIVVSQGLGEKLVSRKEAKRIRAENQNLQTQARKQAKIANNTSWQIVAGNAGAARPRGKRRAEPEVDSTLLASSVQWQENLKKRRPESNCNATISGPTVSAGALPFDVGPAASSEVVLVSSQVVIGDEVARFPV